MMLTDFHSHILPGMDDGSQNTEQSLQMLHMLSEQGVSRVIATPHFYARHDDPAHFLQRRSAAADQLQAAMAECESLPHVELGAEVYFFEGISECNEISHLTIGEKRCILIEMPMVTWTRRMYQELERIYIKQGITPVVAHIDRYIRPLTYRRMLQELEQLPVLIQANAEFFLDRATAGLALRMLRRDQIHVLGSDCHDLTHRKPNLGAAVNVIADKLGQGALEQIAVHEKEIL